MAYVYNRDLAPESRGILGPTCRPFTHVPECAYQRQYDGDFSRPYLSDGFYGYEPCVFPSIQSREHIAHLQPTRCVRCHREPSRCSCRDAAPTFFGPDAGLLLRDGRPHESGLILTGPHKQIWTEDAPIYLDRQYEPVDLDQIHTEQRLWFAARAAEAAARSSCRPLSCEPTKRYPYGVIESDCAVAFRDSDDSPEYEACQSIGGLCTNDLTHSYMPEVPDAVWQNAVPVWDPPYSSGFALERAPLPVACRLCGVSCGGTCGGSCSRRRCGGAWRSCNNDCGRPRGLVHSYGYDVSCSSGKCGSGHRGGSKGGRGHGHGHSHSSHYGSKK